METHKERMAARERRTFVFNRRVLSDQRVYVEADTYAEALEKARADDVYDTGDEVHVSKTIRPVALTQA
jgi:hypothetical protein